MHDPGAYLSSNAVARSDFGADSWVLLSAERYAIKRVVEAQGQSLEHWRVQINRGLITGYNEAFYLTAVERRALIDEHPSSDELIKPLLRGRFIERYSSNWDESYQIIAKFGRAFGKDWRLPITNRFRNGS